MLVAHFKEEIQRKRAAWNDQRGWKDLIWKREGRGETGELHVHKMLLQSRELALPNTCCNRPELMASIAQGRCKCDIRKAFQWEGLVSTQRLPGEAVKSPSVEDFKKRLDNQLVRTVRGVDSGNSHALSQSHFYSPIADFLDCFSCNCPLHTHAGRGDI